MTMDVTLPVQFADASSQLQGASMKIIAYSLVVLYVITDILLVGFLFVFFWWWTHHRKRKRSADGVHAIYRSKATAILGSLILAALGACLAAIATLAVFPKNNDGYSSSWISFFITYSGAIISFFIFWIAGIVIFLHTRSATEA